MTRMSNLAPTGRRFIWQRLDHIELVLVDLRRGIELMAQQTVVKYSEFEQIKYRNIDKDGKIEIEPKELIKEKIGRSPDDWDSIMMRYYFELTPKADLWLG